MSSGVLLSACAYSDQIDALQPETQEEQLSREPTTGETQQSVILAENDRRIRPGELSVCGDLRRRPSVFLPRGRLARWLLRKDLGIPEPFIASPQAWDQTEQNQVIDSMIDKGAIGIAMFPSDAYSGQYQDCESWSRAAFRVVTMGGSPLEPSDAVFCYATDVGASVALGTQELINKLRANGLTKGNIVHLCSSLGDTNTKKRQEAIKECAGKAGKRGVCSLCGTLRHRCDRTRGKSHQHDVFHLYQRSGRHHLHRIRQRAGAGQDDGHSSTSRRVVAIGIDDSQDVLSAIEKGIMYGTMTQNPWGMGYVGIYALKLIKDGYQYKGNKPFFHQFRILPFNQRKGLSSYQQTIESNTKGIRAENAGRIFRKAPRLGKTKNGAGGTDRGISFVSAVCLPG